MARYQRGGRSSIDWGKTILHCAIFIIVISVIQMILAALGIGGMGLIVICLAIVAYYFLPGIIRNKKIKHRDRAARKRDPVGREELLDFDD